MPYYRTIVVLLFFLLLAPAFITAQDITPTTDNTITYVIQPGDTLLTIARRFNTTVSVLVEANGIVNSATIYWGQRLRIPQSDSQVQPTELPPGSTQEHIVRPGEQLNRIALLYNTTISNLMQLNPQITNPNLVYVGQRIIVPSDSATTSDQPVATDTPTPPEATISPTLTPVPVVDLPEAEFAFGLEVNFAQAGAPTRLSNLRQLGVSWIRQEIHWRSFETSPGDIDFETLDPIIDELESTGANILLTITYAPDWARTIQEENGPPDNLANYGAFVSAVASRYAGRVQAYEIWNEPNLRSRWKSTVHPIGAASYVELLRHGYNAIKAADPAAQVISAGLAPTGFNDGSSAQTGSLEFNAIDDRIFLANMYDNGFTDVIDAVGAHPMGWANPPDARCCEASPGVSTHFEDEHFYFLDTVETYRRIMLEKGDESRAIWVTKFGWGTADGVAETPVDPFNIFISYLDQIQQGAYIVRAFQVGEGLGYVGPMFLYNFDGCAATNVFDPDGCYYSLTDLDGNPRPAFITLAALPK